MRGGIGLVQKRVRGFDRQLAARGIASLALRARFRIALSSWLGSAWVHHRPPASAVSIAMVSGRLRRSSSVVAGDELVCVERFGLQGLAARERQEPLRHARRAIRAAAHGVDVARPTVALPRAQAPLQRIDRRFDHREHVVEVVRDAAGELAQRLHLL